MEYYNVTACLLALYAFDDKEIYEKTSGDCVVTNFGGRYCFSKTLQHLYCQEFKIIATTAPTSTSLSTSSSSATKPARTATFTKTLQRSLLKNNETRLLNRSSKYRSAVPSKAVSRRLDEQKRADYAVTAVTSAYRSGGTIIDGATTQITSLDISRSAGKRVSTG
jgi:hypothetical protein